MSGQQHQLNNNNGKFNLWLCINYRKLNSRIQTACQIKVDGSLGKVISNYPLPTIDSILACFNGFKFFSTIDLRSGYYHITLTKEALKSELVKMPTLQYPNPNTPFKWFTDASKHGDLGILHQEETSRIPNAEVSL